MNQNLRISYTLLTLWERHDIQGVMDYIHGIRKSPTPQMIEGLQFDNKACAEAVKNKRLIPEFGWYELKNPRPQVKLTANLKSDSGIPFTLVGVLDLYDDGVIWELKTGLTSSTSYARTKQVRIYSILCKANNMPVNKIYITRYNQYTNKNDVHIIMPSRYMDTQIMKELKQTVAEIQAFVATVEGETNV